MRMPSKKESEGCLKDVHERRSVLESNLASVCQGFTPAMFVWGPPGMGKSHLLRSMLDGMVAGGYQHHTAFATPKGLVLTLAENPHAIHLFEDCERMLKTDQAASVLRAACGSPDDRERWVTWETADEKLKVKITGGIVIVTNENLSRKNGPLQGVASRFRPIHWTMSPAEVASVIGEIAKSGRTIGGVKLTPNECLFVANELCKMLAIDEAGLALDIRLFTEHALPAYAFSKISDNKDWLTLLSAKITGTVRGKDERQGERTDRLSRVAQQIAKGPGAKGDKLRRWTELTGLGKSIFYKYAKVKDVRSQD